MTSSAPAPRIHNPSCWAHSHLMQDSRQLDTTPVDARLYRSFRYSQDALNLAVLQLLQVAKNNGLAQLRRKASQRRLHLAAQFAQQSLLIGPSPHGLFVFHHRHSVVERIGDAIPLRPTVMVNQQITRHAGHPCGETAMSRAITRQGTVDAEEHI